MGSKQLKPIDKKEHVSFAADKAAFEEITSRSNFSLDKPLQFLSPQSTQGSFVQDSETPYLFFIRELSS